MRRPLLDFESRNSYIGNMKAKVSEKGQVTIPKALRTRLGIRAGEMLDFEALDGRLIARKITHADSLDAVFGILTSDGRTVDELIEELRGPAEP